MVKHLEANPLFIKFGWLPVFGLNILCILFLVYSYEKGKTPIRFLSCTALVWLSFIRLVAFINNMNVGNKVISGEITKTMIMAIPMEAKVNYYFITLVVIMLIPVVATLISFYLFKIDHKIEWKK